MASERARPRAPPFIDPPDYARHRPEATLLYELVERHYPEFAAAPEPPERPSSPSVRMTWARRLKRVLGIEIQLCARCGGRLQVIASIEEPELIECILAHRRERGEEAAPTTSRGARAPVRRRHRRAALTQ